MQFVISCVNANGEDITDMVDQAGEVSFEEINRNADLSIFNELYQDGNLTLKNDYAVSFWKSEYLGRPCYYVDHSRIEHVFQ